MIYRKTDLASYKADFIKKFTSFADKSPIMLSFYTDDLGVTVIHENSNTKYFYEWSPEIPVKAFIHHIKQELSKKHYPRISRRVEITRKPTDNEVADMIAQGKSVDDIPPSLTYTRIEPYRIDKIIAMKDEFVLINEDTGKQSCYKMDGFSIYFLKNYRTGKYKDVFEAGDEFFKRSTLIKELDNV